MKKFFLFLCAYFFFAANVFAVDFTKTVDGVIVRPDAEFSGGGKEVQLKIVADNIIHVLGVADKNMAFDTSLVIIDVKPAAVKWTLTSTKKLVTLKTAKLTATVDLQTGAVSFFDAAGKKLVAEKMAGRQLQPAVFEGTRLYSVRQDFTTAPGDAWYGLGQHQEGVFNYKGQQVLFFQNNTEVAVPFLLSAKAYGILWDNYSLTTVGDVRPLHPLSSLQLFSKTGEEGWLTASYCNDKSKPADVALQRAEATIDMPFLGDSKIGLPAEFTPATGSVVWEGSVASKLSGLHQLRFTFGGSIKVSLNGQVVLDRWRKAWNPAPALVPIDLPSGEKVPIRIEWIPEGTESYISLKWQEPLSKEQLNSFSFSSEAGKGVNYYFIAGQSMDDVIVGYRHLTGKAPIVPRWAMGFWQSRERYKTQDEILTTVAEFRKREIPLDNIVLDWSYWKEAEWGSQDFDQTRFPDPAGMTETLHKIYHTNIMISVWPKFYEGIPAYTAFKNKGWLYGRNIADRQRDWIAKGYTSTFYDAFNAAARKGFWDLIHEKIYKKGFDAWWMDASEPDILSNVSPEKRKTQMVGVANGPAAEYLNAYPLQNAKGIYEGQRSAYPNKRVFLLTRSGFAGSQRYAAAIWSGDIGSTWQDMKNQVAAGVNFSMSGLPYWTMDIGGFVVEARFEKPNETDLEEWRELQSRWYQFGAFVPLFRAHGQFPYREIFNIAPELHPAYQSILYYDKLRYRLLPYIYSLAGAAYHADGSIMRGVVMDFPTDTATFNVGDQYLFGPSLLVNPVTKYKASGRPVYLPKGAGWYNFYDGTFTEGGRHISAEAPYNRMPLFVKAGSILPIGPALQYTDEKPADTITLFVYTGANGQFNLYEDEGTNYNYEKGASATIPLQYNDATKTLTIGNRNGSFTGMLQHRIFNIVWVEKGAPAGFDTAQKIAKTITYNGETITVKK